MRGGSPRRSLGAGVGCGQEAAGSGLGSGPRCLKPFKLWRNQAGLGATGGPFFTMLLSADVYVLGSSPAASSFEGFPSGWPCVPSSSPRLTGAWSGTCPWLSLMMGLNRLLMQSEILTQGSSAVLPRPQSTRACLFSTGCLPGDA